MNDEGRDRRRLHLPNERCGFRLAERIFSHPNAQGRRRVAIRRLLTYFHAPIARHQELVDTGELHGHLAAVTLALMRRLGSAHGTGRLLATLDHEILKKIAGSPASVAEVNLYDLITTVLVRHFFRELFGDEMDDRREEIYVRAVSNFHRTMKGTSFRRLTLRRRLVADIDLQLASRNCLAGDFSREEWRIGALLPEHLAGAFFFTGVVQITELVSHAIVELARAPKVGHGIPWNSLRDQVNASVYECLRLYPAFWNTTRHVAQGFQVDDLWIDNDTDVFLNFVEMHRRTWDNPGQFDASRWSIEGRFSARPGGPFCPFGLGPRRCPAKAVALTWSEDMLVHLFSRYRVKVDAACKNSRRLPLGAYCLIHPRPAGDGSDAVPYRRVTRDIDMADRNIWGGVKASFRSGLRAIVANRRVSLKVFIPLGTLLLCRLWGRSQ